MGLLTMRGIYNRECIKIFNTVSRYIVYSPVFDRKPHLSSSYPTHILYAQGWLTAYWHMLILRMLHMGEVSLEGFLSPESPYRLKACILKEAQVPKSQDGAVAEWAYCRKRMGFVSHGRQFFFSLFCYIYHDLIMFRHQTYLMLPLINIRTCLGLSKRNTSFTD